MQLCHTFARFYVGTAPPCQPDILCVNTPHADRNAAPQRLTLAQSILAVLFSIAMWVGGMAMLYGFMILPMTHATRCCSYRGYSSLYVVVADGKPQILDEESLEANGYDYEAIDYYLGRRFYRPTTHGQFFEWKRTVVLGNNGGALSDAGDTLTPTQIRGLLTDYVQSNPDDYALGPYADPQNRELLLEAIASPSGRATSIDAAAFAANTLAWVTIVGGSLWLFVAMFRAHRAKKRLARALKQTDRCAWCAYSLEGLASPDHCPECGRHVITRAQTPPPGPPPGIAPIP